MFDADPTDGAAGPAPVDTGVGATPVSATVSLTPARAQAERGFWDVSRAPGPVQQATPTVNAAADAGGPEEADDVLDARVAALLPNKSTTDWSAVSAFLAAVVPWPASSNDAGWVNLHWSFPDKNSTTVPKTNVLKGGKPYKDIADFVKDVAWRLQRSEGFKDMFFCTSMQRDDKTSPNGKRRAAKSGAAALALKSIWVDIDVGPDEVNKDGKVIKLHYHTEAEALKAILLFASTVGLPIPSAIVRSGGGLHVYWINNDPLTPEEWMTYASGLRQLLLTHNVLADSFLTTDAARILRIPGTFNHKPKYPQPRPVELVDLRLTVYDFPKKLAFLQQFAGPAAGLKTATPKHSVYAEGVTAFTGGPAAAFAGLKPDDTLQAGIDKFADKLLNGAPIFTQCGFLKHAANTGGADYNEPLWNLSLLCTTFMENGNALAHAISEKHKTYSPDDTQAKFDQKMADRADRGVGYPSCAVIAANGCKSCATCPLFAKGKSPLNLANHQPNDRKAARPEQSGPTHESPTSCGDWVDPLDFDQVPVAEAVDRINAAGYFVLTLNGDIYKTSQNGGAIVQKREGFTTLFA